MLPVLLGWVVEEEDDVLLIYRFPRKMSRLCNRHRKDFHENEVAQPECMHSVMGEQRMGL